MKNFTLIFLFILVGFFLINHNLSKSDPTDIKYVKIAGQNIKVDLALTSTEQEKGLSGRQGLNDGEGMLFIFDKPARYYFWTKDMKFPIDIIWLSPDMKVIYIQKNAFPEKYPETYGPDVSLQDAKYVLEVVSGFSDKNNLKVGYGVTFTYW